jgi:hypothetical protein
MRFELVFPWTDWTIKTVVGGRSIDAKIDSGASLTMKLPCSFVYIPFEYAVDTKAKKLKYRFITPYKYLIGTDILNEYDMLVQFNKATIGNNVESVSLELKKHGFSLSTSARKEYAFYQLAPKVEEIEEIPYDVDLPM